MYVYNESVRANRFVVAYNKFYTPTRFLGVDLRRTVDDSCWLLFALLAVPKPSVDALCVEQVEKVRAVREVEEEGEGGAQC